MRACVRACLCVYVCVRVCACVGVDGWYVSVANAIVKRLVLPHYVEEREVYKFPLLLCPVRRNV